MVVLGGPAGTGKEPGQGDAFCRISENPAHLVDLPDVERERIRLWTLEQVGKFIEVAQAHRLDVLVETVLLTRLRRGEAIALSWSDVDLAGLPITVRTNRTMARASAVKHFAKTEDGQRRAPILARLAESVPRRLAVPCRRSNGTRRARVGGDEVRLHEREWSTAALH